MKLLISAWKFFFVTLLLFSLALNVAMFVGGTIYKMASSAFGAATGIRTVAVQHAAEVAELGVDLADERRVGRELRGEVADISDNLVSERTVKQELQGEVADLSDNLVSERRVVASLKGEVVDLTGEVAAERVARRKLSGEVVELSGGLAAERMASKKMRSQLSDTTAGLVTYRGRKMAINEAVDITADRISKRAVKTASRELGSMAGEALPYFGTAVIVGVTALELKDLCDTLKDMSELKLAFNPSAETSDDETKVCSLRVPTKEELWEYAKASPGQAWAAAKVATPTLEEIQNYEFPDIDWTGAWSTTTEGAGSAWLATKDGADAALDATAETTSGWLDSATKYWSGDADDGQKEE